MSNMKRVALLALVLGGCSVSNADTPSQACRRFEQAAKMARRPTAPPLEAVGIAAGLMKSADDALDRGDVRTYHRYLSEAIAAKVSADVEGQAVNAALDTVRAALCSK